MRALLLAVAAWAALVLAGAPPAHGQATETSWPAGDESFADALARIESGDTDKRADVARFEGLLARARSVGDRAGEARILAALATAHMGLNDYHRALELYEAAVSVGRSLADPSILPALLDYLGATLDALGRREEAVATFNEALEALAPGQDDALRAQVLSNLGSSLSSIGEKARAIEVLGEVLALRRQGAPPDVLGQAMLQLGRVHASLGDFERALVLYREALPLHREALHRKHEGDALNNIGTALAAMGRLDEALASYTGALAIYHDIQDSHGEASARNNAGWAHDRRGDFEQAVESFGKAVSLFRNLGARANEAQALTNLGRAYLVRGDSEAALRNLEAALPLRREVKDPRGEAQTLYYIATAQRDRGRLDGARESVEAALSRVEDVRSATPGPRLRASYLATVQDYYNLQIDVLMLLHKERPTAGFAALALESSERARARSLLDLLAESGLDIRAGADASLLERERSLRRLLSARAERQSRLPAGTASEDARARAAREVEEAAAELEAVETQLRSTSSRYTALADARPIGLADIQRDLLDVGTVLLEYRLGEERSYVWAVTRDSLQAHELAPRARIEAAARGLHERLRSPGALADAGAAAHDLAELVLAPVAPSLAGRQIAVVADGALEYVPFDVLPDGGSRAAPLVAGHEVVRVPSASALALLRREAAGRGRPPRDVAVLADPVFGEQDPRVPRRTAGDTASPHSGALSPALGPAVRSVGFADGRLPRLPGTRREAATILSLVAPGRGRQALDFDASRELATSGELQDYRVVHFATHGILDSERPELSGIVLSLVGRDGRPRNGFLRMHELYGLKLPVELVVLSACRTALGREVRGEGLVGLTRGFMYAGATRVMASLWAVDDKATAELMGRFYQGLLGPRRLDPPAALRAAQEALRAERRWQHPYYWAGFVLHGDWR